MENSSTSTLSPLSPKRWPIKGFFYPYSIAMVAGIVVIYALAAIAVFVVVFRAHLFTIGPAPAHGAIAQPNTVVFPLRGDGPGRAVFMPTLSMLLLQDLIYVPLLAFVLPLLPKLAHRSLLDLGLRRPSFSDIVTGIVGAAAAYLAVFCVEVFETAITHTHHVQQETEMFRNLTGATAIVFAFTAIVLAPLMEELVFRGFAFNALLRYMPVGAAAVISGVLFGFAHGQPDVAPMLAACGVVLALIYYRTGCLWSNVIAHGLFNSVSVIALLVLHASAT